MTSAQIDDLIHQRRTLSTGVTLNVVERPGRGAPVICLHGIWDDWQYWLPLVPPGIGPLDRRPLLMVDLRGHGASSKPDSGYALSDYAADVVALVNESGYERVSFFGHSLGALVSLLAAAQMPERIEALVLEEPPLPERRLSEDTLRALLDLKQRSFEAVVDQLMTWRPGWSREAAEASARRLLNTADGVLREVAERSSSPLDVPVPGVEIEAPTLLIRAGDPEERALGDRGLDLLRTVLPNIIMVTVLDAGHTVLRDRPDNYRKILVKVVDD